MTNLPVAPPREPDGPVRLRWFHQPWLPFLVVAAGIVMSLLLWRALRSEGRLHLERTVAAEAKLINEELVARMEPRVLTLVRLAARWGPELGASTAPAPPDPLSVQRREWEMEAALNLSHFAGNEALFLVNPDGQFRWRVPPQQDAPTSFSEQEAAALEAARERRTPRLTGPVELGSGVHGFRAYAPVFHGRRFLGWVAGAFQYRGLFDAILHDLAIGYDIEIAHVGETVYRQRAAAEEPSVRPDLRSRIDLYGSPFVIRVRPGPAVLSAVVSPIPQVVLAGGILVSLLFGLALYYAQKADRRSRFLAAERRRLKRSEAELARSRDYYLILLEHFPGLIWRSNSDAWCDYHNQTWLDFTGRTFEEEQGSGWAEGVHPDDLDPLMQNFMTAFNARAPFQMEYRLRHHSGEFRRVSDHARPIYDLEGGFAGYLGACFDLSQREEALAALRESEEIFRTIFETAPVGISRVDHEGRFLTANDAYLQMLGYSEKELRALTVEQITHPDDWPRNRELYQQLIRKEIPSFELQKRYRRKDGSELWAHNSYSAVFDESGRLLFVHVITQDITEQRRNREELERREILLRDAQEIARMGSWEWDLRSERVEWSDTEYRLFGLVPGSIDLTYANFLALVHPDDREIVKEDVRRTMEMGESETIFRIVRSDGAVRWFESRRRLMRDEAGEPVRMIGTTHDITEMKEAEEALEASEEKYRILTEHSADLITQQAPDGEILYVSPAIESMFGYTPEEVVGRNGREFIFPADLERIESLRVALLHGEPSVTVIFRMRKKSGEARWVETTAQAVLESGSGHFASVISVTRDITETITAGERYRLLQAITAVANEAEAVGPALRLTLEKICEHTEWTVGHVTIADRKTGGIGSIDIWHLPKSERLGDFRAAIERIPALAGDGLPGRVLSSGRAEWIEDLRVNGEAPATGQSAFRRIRSAFAFPIRSGDRTMAVLQFFSDELRPRDEAFIEVMEEICVQLGEMIHRLRAEAALAASEMRFRALSESAHDAILTLDANGEILYCNESSTRIFGYGRDDLVGRPFTFLLSEHTPARRSEANAFAQLMRVRDRSLIGRTVELAGRRRDGGEMPIELVLSWWEAEEGVYFTVILRDITARKQAEEKLQQNIAELARSNAELGLFTYVASHDLREPLRTVASNVQLLKRRLGNDVDPATRKEMDFAVDGVGRMQALLDDLLMYSRVGTDGKPFAWVETETVLAETEQSLGIAIEEHAAEIRHEPLPTVFGDRTQLVQLFLNLLSNALKFCDSRPPRIRIWAQRKGTEWVFSVRDNGIGIEPAYGDHIFTVFQRLHTVEEYPGTGIGLAVCRRIVERHRGRIWVESERRAGSTFRFTIPDPPAAEHDPHP